MSSSRKQALHNSILEALKIQLATAERAAKQAHETATHEESAAETKWDTLGLEASYLAEGQSRRVEACQAAVAAFNQIHVQDFDESSAIQAGALVKLVDDMEIISWVFLSTTSGGLKVVYEGRPIVLVTPKAPLGGMLLGSYCGDELSIGDKRYEVIEIA